MAIPNLQKIQKTPSELEELKVKNPVEFYNLYTRKEGEKVLDKAGFDKMMKNLKQYPLTTDESFPSELTDQLNILNENTKA